MRSSAWLDASRHRADRARRADIRREGEGSERALRAQSPSRLAPRNTTIKLAAGVCPRRRIHNDAYASDDGPDDDPEEEEAEEEQKEEEERRRRREVYECLPS